MNTKKIFLMLAIVCGLVAPAAASVVELAVAPDARQRPEVWATLTEVLMSARKGDTVTLFDVKGGVRVAAVGITEEISQAATPAAKTIWLNKQMGQHLARMRTWLTNTTPSQGNGDFVRYLRGIEMLKTEFSGQPIQALYFGSPNITAPEAYSMANHRYLGDGFLLNPDSLFATAGRERALSGVSVHVIHSPGLAEFSDRNRDLHRDKIRRFFGLYIAGQGGSLATFSGTADHLRKAAITDYPKVDYGRVDASSNKLMVYEVLAPAFERQAQSVQTSLWNVPAMKSPPPSQRSAPLDIGIKWSQNVDLDIYVMAANDVELFYGQVSAPTYDGHHLKDIRAGTSDLFETVSYGRAVPIGQLRVYVNHYNRVSDVPVEVELRMRVANGGIYSKKFSLPPGHGSGGAGNRDASPSWVKIDVPALLGL